MADDAVLLRRFTENGDQEAFRDLVCRHFGLVYGTALRLANGDASLAEDVAQTVFTDLARKARLLPRDIILPGWLHKAARFAAAKAVRGEQRRRIREEEAFAMHDLTPESTPEWDRLRPALDAAMSKLNAADHNAILLHYFEQKSLQVVGAALGISDDAAQKRVSRALVKLRTILIRSGIAVSGVSLSSFLSAGMLPPPDGLAAVVAKASLAKAVALGPPGIFAGLIQNFTATKAGIAIVGLLAFLFVGGATFKLAASRRAESRGFVTVDLSRYLNGRLDRSWTPDYESNFLDGLREGRRVLNRIPFEIHGVVQLEGTEWKRRDYKFPEGIDGIPIRSGGRRIHLLHANSAMADPSGTTVASLILHYSDGDQARFDIRQGMEVLDWWDWPAAPAKVPSDTNTTVAWTGKNPAAASQGARVRLFDTAFVNPQPEKEIQSVDYISAMAGSAPFMVGLTIEH